MENSIKMDDLGGYHYFWKQPYCSSKGQKFPQGEKKTKQCAFCSLCEEQMPGSFQPYLPPQKK